MEFTFLMEYFYTFFLVTAYTTIVLHEVAAKAAPDAMATVQKPVTIRKRMLFNKK